LLDKNFLHKQRFWFLSKHDSICTRCSTGCNIASEENRGQLWRFRARYNPKVNDYWICDEGRFSYQAANDPNLLSGMYARKAPGAELNAVTVDQATASAREALQRLGREGATLAGVLSPFLTVEEAYSAAAYLRGLNPNAVLAMGPVPVTGDDRTFAPDQHEGRTGDTSFVVPRPFTIHAEKCPNRRGVEAVLRHFQGDLIEFANISYRVASGEFRAVLVASDAIDPAFSDEDAQAFRKAGFLVVVDTNVTPLAQLADVVLAGATFAEKAGCYVNYQGRLQYSEAALPPRDNSLPDLDLFAILSGKGSAPIHSRTILAEVARTIPAFSAAADGTVPEFGVLIGDQPDPATVGAFAYADPWLMPRGEKGDRPGEHSPKGGKQA
jgi:NADH-quinone oxidoreductase subunit G